MKKLSVRLQPVKRLLKLYEAPKANGRSNKTSLLVQLDSTLRFQTLNHTLQHIDHQRIVCLANCMRHVSTRIYEPQVRIGQIEWIRQMSINHSPGFWDMYASMAIKDFHSDVSSLMDALAPIAIQIEDKIKPGDKPTFGDIQKGTSRSYRKRMNPQLTAVIDSTENWWPAVKELRNILLHRDHLRIVFGNPDEGILFQVYPTEMKSYEIPQILYSDIGSDIIDFELYSPLVCAEALIFTEELANVAITILGIDKSSLQKTWTEGSYGHIVTLLKALATHLRTKGVTN